MKRKSFYRFWCGFFGFVIFVIASFFTVFSQAQVQAQLASQSCEEIRKVQGLLNCIIKNHPELQRSAADIEISKVSTRIARERPNPELDSKQVFGLPHSEESLTSEVNLAHTVELGGKRQARIQKSRAYQDLISSQHLSLQEKILLESILNLYRLKQFKAEKDAFNETLQTFHHIQKLYRQRPILDPEQKATLSVFALAERELNLKKVTLLKEEIDLKIDLEKAAGHSLIFDAQILPKKMKQWPTLKSSEETESTRSSLLKKTKAELEDAKASYQISKSEAWPNLKVGPSLEVQNQREGNSTSLGFNFSLPLPLYHQNQGHKQQALLEQKKAELNITLAKQELEFGKKKLLQEYQQSLKFLKAYQATLHIPTKHQEVESDFEKGLVSSSLVLEMHRQMIESTQAFHVQEMKALEALWSFYTLEGRILQEKDNL